MEFDETGASRSRFPHKMLLLIDEFPALGKLEIFEEALAFIHPYMVLPLGLVPALYLLWRMVRARQWVWRPWLLLIAIGLTLLPVAGYSLSVFVFVPHYREWLAQGVMLSPRVAGYLLGYGLLWPLAVWGRGICGRNPVYPFSSSGLVSPLGWPIYPTTPSAILQICGEYDM